MKTFGYILLAGWIAFFGIVALLFAFPGIVGHILHPIGGYFALLPASLLLATLLYIISHVYQEGMKKAREPGAKSEIKNL